MYFDEFTQTSLFCGNIWILPSSQWIALFKWSFLNNNDIFFLARKFRVDKWYLEWILGEMIRMECSQFSRSPASLRVESKLQALNKSLSLSYAFRSWIQNVPWSRCSLPVSGFTKQRRRDDGKTCRNLVQMRSNFKDSERWDFVFDEMDRRKACAMSRRFWITAGWICTNQKSIIPSFSNNPWNTISSKHGLSISVWPLGDKLVSYSPDLLCLRAPSRLSLLRRSELQSRLSMLRSHRLTVNREHLLVIVSCQVFY